jgi:hypothetical protein
MTRPRLSDAWFFAGVLGLVSGCASDDRPRLSDTGEARFSLLSEPRWSKTERMLDNRFRHSATTLLDGKVLIVGGATKIGAKGVALGSEPTDRAALFDPVLGEFKKLDDTLHQARWGHTATLLRDGRVLIAGGVDERDAVLASAEIYEPATERFVETGDLSWARALHTATLLPDDRVLFVGGNSDIRPFYQAAPNPTVEQKSTEVAQAEAYRPGEGRFEDLGTLFSYVEGGALVQMPSPAFPQAASLLSDGRVIIAWPQLPKPPELRQGAVSLLYFDYRTNAFEGAGRVNCNGSFPCLNLMLHYEAGSPGAGPSSINIVTLREEIRLEPEASTLTREPHRFLASEKDPGAFSVMTFDPQRGPLVLGRWLIGAGSTRETAVWTARDKAHPCLADESECGAFWSSANSLEVPRAWPTATTLVDGSILVAGGLSNSNSPLSSAEQSSAEVASGDLTNLGNALANGHATTLLADGRVLFTGGGTSKTARAWTVPQGSSLQATPNTSVPQDVGTVRAERAGHQSFLLPSGQVLLAGGETEPEQANEELFDPATGQSRDLGFRLTARSSGLALNRNRYLFAGEHELQLVDAADFSVRPISLSEPLGCPSPSLARLLNGRVAVVATGGIFELDVEQGTLSETAVALGVPRCDTAVAALPDGTLAIAGGTSQQDQERASAAYEIYDPKTRTLSASGELRFGVVGARALVRFSNLMLLGLDSESVVNWRSAVETEISAPVRPSPHQSITTLADGGVLRAWRGYFASIGSDEDYADQAKRLDIMPTDSTDLKLDPSGAVLEVTPGQETELTGLNLAKTWPENSGGNTQASASNAPVAIWIPILDGWPVTGTFSNWSEDRATWHVPHPAFPGLGVLGYVRSGTLHPLRLVRIKELEDSGLCVEGGECASGYCVDGVCCDSACDSSCQACTARGKGGGDDGVCGPVPAGEEDIACDAQEVNTCGRSGLCDEKGKCARFPEGKVCAPGLECSSEHVCNRPHACDTTNDCAEGLVCSAQRECQPAFDKPNTSLGCAPGCRVASRSSLTSELWGLGLALAGAALRRRSRRTPRATSRSAP